MKVYVVQEDMDYHNYEIRCVTFNKQKAIDFCLRLYSEQLHKTSFYPENIKLSCITTLEEDGGIVTEEIIENIPYDIPKIPETTVKYKNRSLPLNNPWHLK
jgi:adenylate cyclase